METDKTCASFINEAECQNHTDETHWCHNCSEILMPKYIRYKKLENKYYNDEIRNRLEDHNILYLLRIYSRISEIIELRKIVRTVGFRPELHDDGHQHRIEKLSLFLDDIERQLSTKYQEDKNTEELDKIDKIDEIDNCECEESEKHVKPIINVPKNGGKKSLMPKVSEDTEILDMSIRQEINSTYIHSWLLENLTEHAINVLSPKFGKFFVRSYVLQQYALHRLCAHGYTGVSRQMIDKSIKSGSTIFIKMTMDKLQHQFLPMRYIDYTIRNSIIIVEDPVLGYRIMNEEYKVSKHIKLNIILNLYDHLPQIGFPEGISDIKYDISETEEINIINQAQNDTLIGKKIELMKTRKCKNTVCLNNCMRTKFFKKDGYLGVTIFRSDKKSCIKIVTYIGTWENGKYRIIETTNIDEIDVGIFRCICTLVAVIKFDADKLDCLTKDDPLYVDGQSSHILM